MAQSVIDLFQQLARNEFGFFERLQTVSEIMSINVPTVHRYSFSTLRAGSQPTWPWRVLT